MRRACWPNSRHSSHEQWRGYVADDDEPSLAMKGAAIYLVEKKGLTKNEVCRKLDITHADLALWLLNRVDIKSELNDQLKQHYISDLT